MKVPKTFYEFRIQLETALAKTPLDRSFVLVVGEVDYEGEVAGALFLAWSELEYALKENKKAGIRKIDEEGVFEEMEGVIHDSILEAYDEYRNPWNHEPGWQPPKM